MNAWVVLDVDDTLVDTFAVGWHKCQAAAVALGLPPLEHTFFAELYGTRSFEECVSAWHPDVSVDAFVAAYRDTGDRYPPQPLGAVREAVDRILEAGFRAGVLTNGPAEGTGRKLAAVGLEPGRHLEFVCHAGNSPERKPSVGVFRWLAGEYAIDPARSWYVSDAAADWTAAAAAGFGTVGLVSGSPHVRGGSSLAQLTIARIDHLAACLPPPSAAGACPRPEPDRRVRAVSIDAGFTLIDHHRSAQELVAERFPAAVAPPVPMPMPDLPAAMWSSTATIEAGLAGYYRALVTSMTAVEDRRTAAEVLTAYLMDGNWYARQGAADLLDAVRAAGLPIAVLSNWQETLPQLMSTVGLADRVDVLIASAACGVAKPEPAAFHGAAEALAVDPADLLHIGDCPRSDAAGALTAGCRALLVRDDLDSPAVHRAMELMIR